jgi:ABC-type glycerol-3-phosphate transport system substrate-binding protein
MLAAVRRLVAIGLLAILVLAACGGGKKTNGEEKKTAAQVVGDARAAAKSASIVHVVGGGVDNGQPIKLDLWIGDGKGKGHLAEGGLSFDIVRIGKTVYVKGSAAFWKRFGGAAAATLLHDKWVKVPTTQAQVQSIIGLTDKSLFLASILGQHGKIENKGLVDYQNQKVVEIRDTTQGGSLYVASQGTAYPVAVRGGKNQGDIAFTDWNADEPVVAPKGAVDLSALGG